MPTVTRHTVLRRRSSFELRIDSDRTRISFGGRTLELGPHALRVLAEFSRPRVLAEALEAMSLGVQGAEEWKELVATVLRLRKAGVLSDDSALESAGSEVAVGYGAAPVHIGMLGDRTRTDSFLEAITRTVRPGDVVVDLGTGTGVFAVAAVRAGARRVYAIEQSGIGRAASALFEANGCADRVTLIEGRSTGIELPERAQVLISEMIGNDPLEERILGVTADAVKRLLEPDGRLIPRRLELFGLPVQVPRAVLGRHVFDAAPLSDWRSWYDVDFSSLAEVPGRPRGFLINPYEARDWLVLSDAITLFEVDLGTIRGSTVNRTGHGVANVGGELDAVLVYFETELAPGVRLSTHPAAVGPDNHWHTPVWLLPESLPLEARQRFAVTYTRGAPGSPDGVSAARLPSRGKEKRG